MSSLISNPKTEIIIDTVDRPIITRFLKHILIRERGIYTLIGSKPVIWYHMWWAPFEDEKKELYGAQKEMFKKHIPFTKFNPTTIDCKRIWQEWKKIEKKYVGSDFLFVDHESIGFGLFINIPLTISILQEHYDEFVKAIGKDFDPKEAVYTLGDFSSSFWQKIKDNHYLMGLLLGYGVKNSKIFHEESFKREFFPFRRSMEEKNNPTEKITLELQIEDLELPVFVVYDATDEYEEKYKKEKEHCIQVFKDKDFIETALQFLMKDSKAHTN